MVVLTSVLLLGVAACSGGPDADAVLRRVDALRGPGRPKVSWKLTFASEASALSLVAVADGERFQRSLPAESACDELVEASAVVVLMLEGDLAEAVEAKARIVRTSREAPAPLVVVPAARSSFDLGLGVGGTLWWPPAWKVVARASWRPPATRFGLGGHLRFQAPSSRRTEVLEITWTRLEARCGPEFTPRVGPLDLAVGVEGVAGVLWLLGASSSGSAAFVNADLGASGAVRVSPAEWVGFKPWVEVSLVGWFRQHRVVLEGTSFSAALPVVEADLVFGVSWGR